MANRNPSVTATVALMQSSTSEFQTVSANSTLASNLDVNRRAKVSLSKEARGAITARRRQASEQYQEDLDGAWEKIDETIAGIASMHHKSIHRVQTELHLGRTMLHGRRSVNAWNAWCAKVTAEELPDTRKENSVAGKDVLVDVIKRRKPEYEALTHEEKQQLIDNYIPIRNAKNKGRHRLSARSRVNHIVGTLKRVEDELDGLRTRTGLESSLCAVSGSTNTPIRPVVYETDGLTGFMSTAMRIDRQDLTSRMEGYCLQGVRGAAHNHRERVSSVRAEIRNIIGNNLCEITGDQSAQMRYKDFWQKVVQRYKVQIEGWPVNIPFSNLSDGSRSLTDLESFLHKWKTGRTHWRMLTSEEYEKLENDRNEQIERGEITLPKRKTRSDHGTKRSYGEAAMGARKRARITTQSTGRSASTVPSDDEDEADNDQDGGSMQTTTTVTHTTTALPTAPESFSNVAAAAPTAHNLTNTVSSASGSIASESSNFLSVMPPPAGTMQDEPTGSSVYDAFRVEEFFDFDFDELLANSNPSLY